MASPFGFRLVAPSVKLFREPFPASGFVLASHARGIRAFQNTTLAYHLFATLAQILDDDIRAIATHERLAISAVMVYGFESFSAPVAVRSFARNAHARIQGLVDLTAPAASPEIKTNIFLTILQ